jgi:hypothetical protein
MQLPLQSAVLLMIEIEIERRELMIMTAYFYARRGMQNCMTVCPMLSHALREQKSQSNIN